MDVNLLDKAEGKSPKINPRVANGLVVEQLPMAMNYLDRVWRSLDLPEELEYVGCSKVPPDVKFKKLTEGRDGKYKYELAPNDFVMGEFKFTLATEQGVINLYPKYLLIPYCDVAGITHIRGNEFAIHSVLTDRAFSVSGNSVFKKLNRMKFTFYRCIYHYNVNNVITHAYVPYSWIHHEARKRFGGRANTSNLIFSTLVNYIFAKYGALETFKMYLGVDVEIGVNINADTHPPEKWDIYSTSNIIPKMYKNQYYERTTVKIAMSNKQRSKLANALIASFFYMLDHHPHSVDADDITDPDDPTRIWKIILGQIIIERGTSQGLIVKSVEEHQRSVDEYMDKMAKDTLREEGLYMETIYDMFIHVINLLMESTPATDNEVSSIYGKQLSVLTDLMSELVQNINKSVMYKLRSLKNKKGYIDENDVNKIFRMIKTDALAGLSNHANHPEVTTVSTSSDNYLIGVTNEIVTQDKLNGTSSKSKINLDDPAKHLHVSIAEAASFNVLPKSDPTGRNRLSPYVKLDKTNKIVRKAHLVDLLDRTQYILTSSNN